MTGPELNGRDELIYYFFPPAVVVTGIVSLFVFAWLGWYGVNEFLFFAWPVTLVCWVVYVLWRNWRLAGQTYFLLWMWVLVMYVGAILMPVLRYYFRWDNGLRSVSGQRFGVVMLVVLVIMGVVQFYIRTRWWDEEGECGQDQEC